jgi:hypothetical protein
VSWVQGRSAVRQCVPFTGLFLRHQGTGARLLLRVNGLNTFTGKGHHLLRMVEGNSQNHPLCQYPFLVRGIDHSHLERYLRPNISNAVGKTKSLTGPCTDPIMDEAQLARGCCTATWASQREGMTTRWAARTLVDASIAGSLGGALEAEFDSLAIATEAPSWRSTFFSFGRMAFK